MIPLCPVRRFSERKRCDMAYFPIFIKIEQKKCVILGGGKVALRKAQTLLRYGADVHIVSQEICKELRELLPPEKIWQRDLTTGEPETVRYLPAEEVKQGEEAPTPGTADISSEEGTGAAAFLEDAALVVAAFLEDAALVVAATGSRQVNSQAAQFCRSRKIPVNVADAPEECTFFFPAVVKKGDVSIGVNTAGKSPVVSSRVRRKVEAAIPEYYGELTDQLGQLREYVKEHVSEESARRAILKQAAAEAFSHERTLSPEEIHSIIRQVLNHGTISGRPVGH